MKGKRLHLVVVVVGTPTAPTTTSIDMPKELLYVVEALKMLTCCSVQLGVSPESIIMKAKCLHLEEVVVAAPTATTTTTLASETSI